MFQKIRFLVFGAVLFSFFMTFLNSSRWHIVYPSNNTHLIHPQSATVQLALKVFEDHGLGSTWQYSGLHHVPTKSHLVTQPSLTFPGMTVWEENLQTRESFWD